MTAPGTPWLTVGQLPPHPYSRTEAETVLLGYAFGREPLAWNSPGGVTLDFDPAQHEHYRWGYVAYDCCRSCPHGLTVSDVLVTTAINSRAQATQLLAMLAASDELSSYLVQVSVQTTFWDLPRTQLATFPNGTTPATWLWRAWALLVGFDGVQVTLTHKVLHHKRPWFFPILDRLTVTAYPNGQAWVGLHGELVRQATQFTQLEDWFAVEAARRGGVALTRLRIHDILLWAKMSGQFTALIRAGEKVRSEPPRWIDVCC